MLLSALFAWMSVARRACKDHRKWLLGLWFITLILLDPHRSTAGLSLSEPLQNTDGEAMLGESARSLLSSNGTFDDLLATFDLNVMVAQLTKKPGLLDAHVQSDSRDVVLLDTLPAKGKASPQRPSSGIDSQTPFVILERAGQLLANDSSFDETLHRFQMHSIFPDLVKEAADGTVASSIETETSRSTEESSTLLQPSLEDQCGLTEKYSDLGPSCISPAVNPEDFTEGAPSPEVGHGLYAESELKGDRFTDGSNDDVSLQVADASSPGIDRPQTQPHFPQQERDARHHLQRLQDGAWFLRGMNSLEQRAMALADRAPGTLSVTHSYFRDDPRSTPMIAKDGVQRDATDLGIAASLPGNITTQARVAFSAFDSQTQRMSDERRNRLLDFRIDGEATYFRYGVEYRSVGKGIRYQLGQNLRLDQEGSELWAERSLGWMNFKAVMSEFSTNVDQDFRRPRTSMSLTGLVSSITIPSGPTLSFSYLQGNLVRSGKTTGGIAQESTVQRFGGSLYYWRETWEIHASTNFMPSRQKLDPSQETASFYHDLSIIYHPTDSLWISPYLSYAEDQLKWSGVRSQSSMAMLSATWATFIENLKLNLFGLYMRDHSTDGWMDATMTMVMNSLVCDIGAKKGQRTLSFDVISTRYLDNIYRPNSYNEFFVRILFSVMNI